MKWLAILLILTLFAMPGAQAHRDGCHSKHSCPSDTGSYVCGDKGYCSECPDNKYCKAGKPISKIQINAVKASAKKTEVPHCTGNTLCINGVVKSIIDGDTLQIDTYKVRLSLTNTPEKGQTGYAQAKGFTKYLCPVGSTVKVDQDDKQPFDRFKRLVGKVYCSEKLLNYELLENNHAKILKQYCTKSEFGKEGWATKHGC
ncbi:MAG TPA: thermonuclease family protein [Candidatus Nitrosotenuis sp.]|nr:thermonuclease family protein [Candidatus Nitrosotenuis sp.]